MQAESEKALLTAVSGVFRPECGVKHSDLLFVGRKSGSPEMPDDDFCMVLPNHDPIRRGRGGLLWVV
jgi:hypothetical protein